MPSQFLKGLPEISLTTTTEMLQSLNNRIVPKIIQVYALPERESIVITTSPLQQVETIEIAPDLSSPVPLPSKETEQHKLSFPPPIPSIDDMIYICFNLIILKIQKSLELKVSRNMEYISIQSINMETFQKLKFIRMSKSMNQNITYCN